MKVTPATVATTSATRWEFQGTIVLSEAIGWESRVVVDLSEPDVVLPSRLREQWPELLKPGASVHENRLYVECSFFGLPTDGFSVSFRTGHWRVRNADTVMLATNSLLYTFDGSRQPGRISNLYRRICPTHIRFGEGDETILGRPLLDSLSEIVFDFDSKIVEFHPLEQAQALTVQPAGLQALVPVFSDAIISFTDTGPAVFCELSRNAEGFVLVNSRPAVIDEGIGWRLIRTRPAGIDREDLILNELFATVSVRLTHGGLQFWTLPAVAGAQFATQVTLRRRRDYVAVIMVRTNLPTQTVRMEDLDLPETRIVGPNSVTEQCAICLEKITQGEELQSMRRCPHGFHYDCVKEWLEREHQTCPTCRIEVAVREHTTPSPAVSSSRQHSCCIS